MSFTGIWKRQSVTKSIIVKRDAVTVFNANVDELVDMGNALMGELQFGALVITRRAVTRERLQALVCDHMRNWIVNAQKAANFWSVWWESDKIWLELIAKMLGIKRGLVPSYSVGALDPVPEGDSALSQRCAKRIYDWFSSERIR